MLLSAAQLMALLGEYPGPNGFLPILYISAEELKLIKRKAITHLYRDFFADVRS